MVGWVAADGGAGAGGPVVMGGWGLGVLASEIEVEKRQRMILIQFCRRGRNVPDGSF